MTNTIDLHKIFKDTWGYVGLPYPEIIAVRGMPQKYDTDKYSFSPKYKVKHSQQGVSIRTNNENGVEIFMPVWLSKLDREAMQYLLPNTMMSITSKKNIVTTTLVNRDGTVKEEISMGDWEINIRGVLVGREDFYPDGEKQILVDWYKEKATFNIQNARTAICLSENEKVVITELRFPEIRGYENTQPYELKLLSDVEFSLFIG